MTATAASVGVIAAAVTACVLVPVTSAAADPNYANTQKIREAEKMFARSWRPGTRSSRTRTRPLASASSTATLMKTGTRGVRRMKATRARTTALPTQIWSWTRRTRRTGRARPTTTAAAVLPDF